jgi:uncharacterized protein
VLPITDAEVLLAKDILLGASASASARDALHVAILRTHDIDQIMTFDRGFERYPGVRRIGA